MHTFNPMTPDDRIRPDLLEFFRLFWPSMPEDVTVDELHDLTQQWVLNRKTPDGSVVQRWDARPWSGFDKFQDVDLLERFAAIGFVDEVVDVESSHFDYAIVPGGTPAPQRRRLALAAGLWESGVHFDNLIFMGGRKLDPKKDTVEKLVTPGPGMLPIRPDWAAPASLTGTETDLNRHVWDQSVLPGGLSLLDPLYITGVASNPDKPVGARDQIKVWFQHYDPAPGSVVIPTVMPHWFQLELWQQELGPLGFTVEAVAASARHGLHDTATLADGVARAFHAYWKKTK